MTQENSNALLTESHIAAAADIGVFDARGNKILFGALFELEKTIVVFISEWVVAMAGGLI